MEWEETERKKREKKNQNDACSAMRWNVRLSLDSCVVCSSTADALVPLHIITIMIVKRLLLHCRCRDDIVVSAIIIAWTNERYTFIYYDCVVVNAMNHKLTNEFCPFVVGSRSTHWCSSSMPHAWNLMCGNCNFFFFIFKDFQRTCFHSISSPFFPVVTLFTCYPCSFTQITRWACDDR